MTNLHNKIVNTDILIINTIYIKTYHNMGNSCGSMCNAKNDQNELHTESKIAGWGTSKADEEHRKSPSKNAQPKAQAGYNGSTGKGGNTAVSHEFSNEGEEESETTI